MALKRIANGLLNLDKDKSFSVIHFETGKWFEQVVRKRATTATIM